MADPIWLKNLRDAILLDPLILIHGNTKDLFPIPVGLYRPVPDQIEPRYVTFDVFLALEFERAGFPVVVLYDPMDGAVVLRGEMAPLFQQLAMPKQGAERAAPATAPQSSSPAPGSRQRSTNPPPLARASVAGGKTEPGAWMVRLETRQTANDFFRTLYDNVFPQAETPVAVVCRFTDRYLHFTDRQDLQERELSLLIQKAAITIPQQLVPEPIHSRIALIFNSQGEVPQELYVQSPFAHSVLVPEPTLEEREDFVRANANRFDQSEPGDRFDPDRDGDHLRLIANLSDGMKTQDMLSLVALSGRERLGLGVRQVKDLLDRFKFGTRENAWLKVKPETLRNAKELLTKRVKGQDEVVDEVIPVLVRAKLGMTDPTGAQYSSKPRGAFFFVGPTGVGKTELSKAIAELIFGDERAIIRFDMSEYSEEHQQARLIGAPPGYVGFDQGGQLTNAILEKPFSVVLFDEIEKAHGRILDKFLQILDEGRLTDGMGRTVYFSEAILIFTSNLGTAPRAATTNASTGGVTLLGPGSVVPNVEERYAHLSELSYDELCEHFRAEVKDFFVNRLGRPEILNRIGEDNVLVFNFLKDDEAKNRIVDQQIENLRRSLKEKYRVGVFCTKAFKRMLVTHPNGFERNGARGVRNLLNRFILNPLAEQLFLDAERCLQKTFRADYLLEFDQIAQTPFDKSALRYEWINE